MTFKLGDLAPPDLPLRRVCWRKLAHRTHEEADRQLESMVESRRGDPAMMEVYLCPVCYRWHVGHNRRTARALTDVRAALREGGALVVFLGTGYSLPSEFTTHPRVRVVAANTLSPARIVAEVAMVRAAILSDRIDHRTYLALYGELKRRRTLFVLRRSVSAIVETLHAIWSGGDP